MRLHDEIPAGPPLEVLVAMLSAARVYASLRACGLKPGYARDARTGRITLQLRNVAGIVVREMCPSEAVALACGEPISDGV